MGNYSIIQKDNLTEAEVNSYCDNLYKSGLKIIGVFPKDKTDDN